MALSRNTLTAGLIMLVLTVLLGVVYPLAITGISQLAFPASANGSQIHNGATLLGSSLIGQQFTEPVLTRAGKVKRDSDGNPVTTPDPRYFQSRPSATSPADNAAATTFSNLGPDNRTTEQEIAGNIAGYLRLNKRYDPRLTAATVPVDAADSSASGIDPDISPANAWIQAHRIAAVRRIPLAEVDALIAANTTGRSLGIFGEAGVNVLRLNLALDSLQGGK
jgi:potassium-transporting ATPase KdpC subunit